MKTNITILKANVLRIESSDETELISFEELKKWLKSGAILKRFFKYKNVRLKTARLDSLPKPLLTAILLSIICRDNCVWEDEQNQQRQVSTKFIFELGMRFLRDFGQKRSLLKKIRREVASFYKTTPARLPPEARPPVYFRTDLVFGLKSGGSVGHIAGVLNNLSAFFREPIFFSSDRIPMVRLNLRTHIINPSDRFWDFPDLPSFAYNETFYRQAKELLDGDKPAFIYQRYSTNNYCGVKLAHEWNIPFVLEYNGSEIWINRHWGKPLKYESLSEDIELLNLRFADIIVVVSQPMKDELVQRGIDQDKILVNPNGVDPDQYSPQISSSGIAEERELKSKTVLGFIGTFGKWHGTEQLVQAYALLLKNQPAFRESTRLLLIGDGMTMPAVKQLIIDLGISKEVILTGIVPQQRGPAYLAACDILVSPHVPNPDGTPFFGSPTKLFEYMAMGKGIVASNLDQIGEILTHMKTAYMVKPGDVESLEAGLKALISDSALRQRLGAAVREEAVAKHTWKEHTRKIADKLRERCGQI